MRTKNVQALSSCARYVTEKVKSDLICLNSYVTTDSILQQKQGRQIAENLPPTPVSLIHYRNDDVLVANIRPYLKKIWRADCEGGCSQDVLVFRAKSRDASKYLHALLLQDRFYDYVMLAPRGSKMPRGDEEHIMRFPVVRLERNQEIFIGDLVSAIESKIALNRKKIEKLEALAKTIYDYWFVQFDFPDANGCPYKSSGGKMVYNPILKREIPAGWEVGNLYRIAEYENGLACQKFRPREGEAQLPVVKIREMHEGLSADSEFVSVNIPEKHKLHDGDLLFSWSASLEVMLWCGGDAGLNQHIFKVIPKDGFSTGYVLLQLSQSVVNFIKIAEARKTTMGHITSDHIEHSCVALPDASVRKMFAAATDCIFARVIRLRQEARRLISRRDFLLPLLMNGQVEVGE